MKEKNMDLNLLELLTQEVIKEEPEEKKLKKYMKQAGIKYTKDPIARIQSVLEEIHFMENEEKKNG